MYRAARAGVRLWTSQTPTRADISLTPLFGESGGRRKGGEQRFPLLLPTTSPSLLYDVEWPGPAMNFTGPGHSSCSLTHVHGSWGSGSAYELYRPRPPILPSHQIWRAVFTAPHSLPILGRRGDRTVSTMSGHSSSPPRIIWGEHVPWASGGGISLDVCDHRPPPSPSAGPAVFSSAGPLVVLLLRHDGLAEVDHRLPRSPASQHSID